MLPNATTTAELLRDPERRHRLVGLCGAISGDRGAAEDLAQETLLEAWRNASKVHDPAGLDRWLAAIARNVCKRWARGRAREAAVPTLAPEAHDEFGELERAELVELLDRALAELPTETREALVQRYVYDFPHAEIASRLGVSEDAVAMRLARGKGVLRRILAAELRDAPPDDWTETRVWCVDCGRTKLVLRRGSTLAVRCPSCQPSEADRSVDLKLDDPVFASLVGDLVRPASILRRVGRWSARYFSAREASCTRCGASSRVQAHRREDAGKDEAHALGLVATCVACGEQAWSSAAALALGQPNVQAFRREHPRIRLLPARTVDGGLVVSYANVLGSAQADVVLDRDTLNVLAVHAA